MRTIITMYSFLFLVSAVSAQNYEAKYSCIYSSGIPIQAGSGSDSIITGFPLLLEVEMMLLCNEKYIMIEANLISSETFPDIDLKVNAESKSILIDIKRGLALIDSEKICRVNMSTLKKKQSISKRVRCRYYTVNGYENYTIEGCKDIPWFINPFFVKSKYGVKTIMKSDLKIELVSFEKTNKRIIIPKNFEFIDEKNIMCDHPFFDH